MLQGMDLGARHTPTDGSSVEALSGCVWRKRHIEVFGSVREQYLVMDGQECSVLGSGFTEAAAAHFAGQRLAFLARPPESFSALLVGCSFGTEGVGEQQVIDPDGAVIGRSVSGRELACLQAEKVTLARGPKSELSLDEFSKIAYAVQVRRGLGRVECSTVIDGDEQHLRSLIHDVYQLSPNSRQEGEDSEAFIRRVRSQLVDTIDMDGVQLYVGHVALPELGGTLFLVAHTERLSPQAAIRTAYQAEIDDPRETAQARERAQG